MCEHCLNEEVSIEEYPGEDSELCEWLPDDLGEEELILDEPPCNQVAEYVMTDTYVQEHLCRRHAEITRALEAHVAEALDDAFGSGVLQPVEQPHHDSCQFFDLLTPDGSKCQEKVEFAFIVTSDTFLCCEHAKEYRDSLAKKPVS